MSYEYHNRLNPCTRTISLLEQRHDRAHTGKARAWIEQQLEEAFIREAIYYADHPDSLPRE